MGGSKAVHVPQNPPWFPHAAVPPFLHATWWFFWYHWVLAVWAPLSSLLLGKPQLLHRSDTDGRHGVFGYTCRSLFYTLVKELHDNDGEQGGGDGHRASNVKSPRGATRAGLAGSSSPSAGTNQSAKEITSAGGAKKSSSGADGDSGGEHNWSCKGGKKILVSPLMHRNGFLAVMQNACKDDPSRLISLDLDVAPDCTGTWRLVVPSGEGEGEGELPDPSEVGMVVVTHLFGVRYGLDWCEPYRRAGAIIVEDAVQGGAYSRWRAQPLVDVSLFSAGQDKLPTAMGGGIMATHSSALARAVSRRVEAYKEETLLQRLWFLLLKIPTFLLYNQGWFLVGFAMCLRIMGKTLFDTAHAYRKANSGFDHDNFERRPSDGLVMGLQQRFLNPLQSFENQAIARRKRLRQRLSPDARAFYFPWYQAIGLGPFGTEPGATTGTRSPSGGGMQRLSAPNDAQPQDDRWCNPGDDLCIYQHVHVGEDRPGFLRQLQGEGFIVTHQQTWAAQDAERWNHVLGRMCLLPAPVNLSEASIDAMGDAMEVWYQAEMGRYEKEGRTPWGADAQEEGKEEDKVDAQKGKGEGEGKGTRKRRGSRSGSQ